MAPVLTIASIGLTAMSTIAGAGAARAQGVAQNNAAQYEAQQLDMNAASARAAGQRRMLDTQDQTRLLQSRAIANAAGSGVNPGVGSPLATVGGIAQRGSYKAAMDLWRGQNEATGLENQATGVRYSGNAALIGSQYAAAGTIAGGAGSMLTEFGRYAYPQMYGGMR